MHQWVNEIPPFASRLCDILYAAHMLSGDMIGTQNCFFPAAFETEGDENVYIVKSTNLQARRTLGYTIYSWMPTAVAPAFKERVGVLLVREGYRISRWWPVQVQQQETASDLPEIMWGFLIGLKTI